MKTRIAFVLGVAIAFLIGRLTAPDRRLISARLPGPNAVLHKYSLWPPAVTVRSDAISIVPLRDLEALLDRCGEKNETARSVRRQLEIVDFPDGKVWIATETYITLLRGAEGR